MIKRFVLLFLIFSGIASTSFGQSYSEVRITGDYNGRPLRDVLFEIESDTPIRFYYLTEWMRGLNVQGRYEDYPLTSFMEDVLADYDLDIIFYDDYTIVFKKEPVNTVRFDVPDDASGLITEVIGDSSKYIAGRNAKITGTVRDANSEVAVSGVNIEVEDTDKGSVTNSGGFYSLSLPGGIYYVKFDHIGYGEERKRIKVFSSGRLDVDLFDAPYELEEVTITGEAADINVTSTQMGVTQLSQNTLNKMPAFMGEVDVVKSLLLLPGVTSVGEGTTGLNVRGGSADQNLLLLEGAPIFNSSHVFGFFSIFNSDVVNDVTLYRGGIPAKYGGRLSSVMEIGLKEGDQEELHGTGGAGLVASRLTLQGPIAKGKTSFIFSGRGSYLNYILKRIDHKDIQNSTASFWDATLKLDHRFSQKSRLTATGYVSDDEFTLGSDSVISWSNKAASIKYSKIFGENLIGDFTAAYSNYEFSIFFDERPEEAFNMFYDIDYASFRADFTTNRNNHKIDFGLQSIFYHFQPGDFRPVGSLSSSNTIKVDNERSIENALYLSDEIELNPKLSFMLGLRGSMFSALGPGVVSIYDETLPRDPTTQVDSLQFGSGEAIETYFGLEPRASLRYQIDDVSSVKLGYNRMRQYINLISNTTAPTPFDIWQSSNFHIKPQTGDQLSLGYFRNFLDNQIEASIEGYYKSTDFAIDYKDGADLLVNRNLEADLVQGDAEAFGVEVLLQKRSGRLNGWASYTYSRTFLHIDSEFRSERVNLGNRYPANFDKPHDLTFVMNYQISRRWSFASNFTYSTGRPVTAPESRYSINGIGVSNFVERNGFRIPDYHRLDISFTTETNLKKDKKWEGSWTFAIYNVYSRDNAYSVFFKNQDNNRIPKAFKLSILARAFPSVTYNFKF
ncbi:MAG: TonB-dependent receptor [Cyclobacteriaceae bacterium]